MNIKELQAITDESKSFLVANGMDDLIATIAIGKMSLNTLYGFHSEVVQIKRHIT